MNNITFISWDWLENRYIDNLGTCYKTLEEIPQNYHHLVKPIKPVGLPRQTRRSS